MNMYATAKDASHTDTAEYLLIGECLNAVSEVADDAPIDTMVRAIVMLRESVVKYLDEKNSQWRPFPSVQRVYRLKYANNILGFCNNRMRLLRDPVIKMTMTHKQALKRANDILETDPDGMNVEKFFDNCPESLNGKPKKEKDTAIFEFLQRDPLQTDEEYQKQKLRESREKKRIENEGIGQNENMLQNSQMKLIDPEDIPPEVIRREMKKMQMDMQ